MGGWAWADGRGLGLDLGRGGGCFEEPDSVNAPNMVVLTSCLPVLTVPQYLCATWLSGILRVLSESESDVIYILRRPVNF